MTTGARRLILAAALTAALAAALTSGARPAFAVTETVAPQKPEPVLVVKSFKTNPTSLVVGGRFKLELFVDNMVNVDAKNVVVTAGTATAASASAVTSSSVSGNTPEVVVLGTNTKFVGVIDGKATNRGIVFELMSNPKGFPGPFSLPITIQMDSPNGGRITSVQSIGLTFTRTLVFDVGALSYPRKATVGRPFVVSVSVKNTNDFQLGGVALAFEGAGIDWAAHESTVGVLAAGAESRLVATGVPQTAGTMAITMSISYKDDYNEVKQIRREFTVAVAPKPAAPVPRRRTAGLQLLLFFKALIGLGG